MIRRPCPDCGSYEVYPHCNDLNCNGLQCMRAFCGYDSGDCTRPSGRVVPPVEEVLDRAPGVIKQKYHPVLQIGTFTKALWSAQPIANGWVMDISVGQPWPPGELFAMWAEFSAIRALPGREA